MPLTRARHARTQPIECPLCKLAVPSFSMGEHFTKKHGLASTSKICKMSAELQRCPRAVPARPLEPSTRCTLHPRGCIARRHEKVCTCCSSTTP
jgi:hypothetical protein